MSDEPCQELATYRVKWPGQAEAFYCSGHADDLREIAECLDDVPNDPVVVEPLRGTIARRPCASTSGRMQRVNIQTDEAEP